MADADDAGPVDGLILAGGPGERRIALLRGDEVVEFVIDRGQPVEGDILLGRVTSRPTAGSTFVEIGADLPGYLPRPGDWHEGQPILVMVTAEARRNKGAVLTDRLRLDGLPSSAEALRQQAARTEPPARILAPGALARLLRREKTIARVLVDDPALLPEARRQFPDAELSRDIWRQGGAADALERALERVVPLPGGGRVIIDEAAGATMIDVDSGGMDRDEANRQAMAEIARQLRLRNIAGQIVIDPISGDSSGAIHRLADELKRHLAADPNRSDLLGVTRMRMIELVRPRRQPSLSDYYLAPPQPRRNAASLALDALQAVLAEAAAAPLLRIALFAAPAVVHYLDSRPELLAECAERLGHPLALICRTDLEGFEIGPLP